eukprot:204225_1
MKLITDYIIVLFKYKTYQMNTQTVDWDKIKQQLKSRNITGKSVPQFNNLLFEFIGIHDFEVVNHLIAEIEVLKKKYNDSKYVDKNNIEIPKEYLCPITKQIMQDPVMAFDGHSYERNAIESYLKIH